MIVIDTETTGLEPGSRLAEIAALRVDSEDGRVLDIYHEYVNPGMPMPADVSKINGITNAVVIGARCAADVLTDLFCWIDGEEIGAIHNAPYDCGIIGWEAARAGLVVPPLRIIDTLSMARAIGATKRNGLAALVEHYGIQVDGPAHSALSDADACRKYWLLARNLFTAPAWDPVPFEDCCEYRYVAPAGPIELLPHLVAGGSPYQFRYVDAKGVETDRTITPYGWALMPEDVIMFHGHCHMRQERRTFRADRIHIGESA